MKTVGQRVSQAVVIWEGNDDAFAGPITRHSSWLLGWIRDALELLEESRKVGEICPL